MKKYVFSFLIIIVLASVSVFAQDKQEKETPPQGGEPKDFNIPQKSSFTLDNGLNVVLIPYGAIPKATVKFVIKTGNIHEDKDHVWLSDLTGDLMEEGSTSLTSKEIADKMAGMGGDLNIGVGMHTTALTASVLYEFTPDAVKLMADVLKNPRFPESEIDRLKNDMKRNLSISLSRPQDQAAKAFYAEIYPDHPYGRLYPTEEMVSSYTVADVKKFYEDNFGAKRTTVYVAGKFDPKEVEAAVREAFGDWKEGPEENYVPATPVSSQNLVVLDRPGAPQSTISIGLPVADPSSPDYIALDVMNSLLGGSFGSRITSNIREDKGYTYSPHSSIDDNYKSSVWVEDADVTTQYTGASLKEIVKEIHKLQDEAPAEDELKGIQNYEAGIFVLRNSTPGGIINQLVFLDIHNLDESYLKNRVKNIYAVTPAQVQQMAKKYINPKDMTLVVVGDKKVIDPQVKEVEKMIKEGPIQMKAF